MADGGYMMVVVITMILTQHIVLHQQTHEERNERRQKAPSTNIQHQKTDILKHTHGRDPCASNNKNKNHETENSNQKTTKTHDKTS